MIWWIFFKGICFIKFRLISFFNARYPTDSLRGPVQTLRRGAERRVFICYALRCLLWFTLIYSLCFTWLYASLCHTLVSCLLVCYVAYLLAHFGLICFALQTGLLLIALLCYLLNLIILWSEEVIFLENLFRPLAYDMVGRKDGFWAHFLIFSKVQLRKTALQTEQF